VVRGRRLGLVLAVMLGLLWPGAVGRAVSGQTGFVVSPAFAQIEIKPGQPQAQYALQLTNHNQLDQTFTLQVVDFGTLDESGGVAFLGAPTSELEHKYGLASWMTLEKNTVFVPAGKSASVMVTIANRASLASGGHYGAVLATAVGDPGTPSGDSVGVKQVLSSLVLVTKDGGAQENLRLDGQTADAHLWHLPTRLEQRFQNTGNVHVVPRGTVEVKDPAGRVVERAAINDGSQVILPESFRRYRADFTALRPAIWPGRYSLVSTYRYDGTDQTQTTTTNFWYAGQAAVWGWGLVLVLVLVVLTLAGWLCWRRRRRRA